MKKFTLLAAAALIGLSANAEGYYFNGNGNWAASWSESALASRKFVETETPGVYTLNVGKLSGDFLIIEFKAGETSVNWNNKITPKNGQSSCIEGQDVAYKQGNSDPNWKYPSAIENCVLTLDTNAKTLKAAGQSVANQFTVVYLVGDFGGGWSETQTNYPLNKTAENTYEGEYTLSATTNYLKPKAGDQVLGYTGSDLVPEMGEEYTLVAGGDKAVKLNNGTYSFKVVVDQEANTGVLTVTSDSEPVITEIDVYLAGPFCEWHSNDPNYKFSYDGEGIYTLSLDNFSGQFKVVANGNWLGYINTPIESAQTYNLGETYDQNCTLASDPAKNVVFTFNQTNNTLTVTFEAGALTVPDAMYVFGNLADSDWTPADGLAMTKSENIFTIDNVALKTVFGEVYAQVAFSSVQSSDWSAVNAARYGAAGNDNVVFGEGARFITPTENNFKVVPTETNENGEFRVNISMNFDTQEVTFTYVDDNPVSIASLQAAENGNAIYFNMQGQRVENPTEGLYIKVQNGKALKVVK